MMSAGTAAGQTRPEGGADATLGPARPAGPRAYTGVAVTRRGLLGARLATSTIGSS